MKKVQILWACVLALLDWASKWWVLQFLRPTDEWVIIPGFFQIILAKNPGIAFGFFQEGESLLKVAVFSCISLAGILFLVLWGDQIASESVFSKTSLALILGGIIGNLGDRLYHGYVVDFLDVSWRQYHWPTFNLADSCITVGVLMLACVELISPRPSTPKPINTE